MVLYSNSLRTFCRLHNGNVSKAILDLQCLLTSSASSSSISPLNEFQKNEEEKDKKLDSTTDTVSQNHQNNLWNHTKWKKIGTITNNYKYVFVIELVFPFWMISRIFCNFFNICFHICLILFVIFRILCPAKQFIPIMMSWRKTQKMKR